MIISTTTIIAGAVVVLLAVLGSLINPFLRSLRFQKTETAENQPPVSILITAHDNLAELERNLPMFLRQQYAADYQVIVVCQSTDGETQDFLKRTAAENPHLYYTYIPESSRYMSRKKLQITLGVKAAKHEWIILTEPNCRPSNDKWLQTMARQCQDPNHLVLGYVALDEETKSVRRFDSIRKAYYVLRRAQQTYGNPQERLHEGTGLSGQPGICSRRIRFSRQQVCPLWRYCYRTGLRCMAHPRSTIEQELAQCPPLSAGFTQESGKSRFHANPHVLRPSHATSQPDSNAGRSSLLYPYGELDSYRMRRFQFPPAVHRENADSQQGHQTL